MKFLADMGVSPVSVQALQGRGHDVVHLMDEGLHRLPDPEILEKARKERRIILTFDLDFGDLLALGSLTGPSVVIFRLPKPKPSFVAARALAAIEATENIPRKERSSSSKRTAYAFAGYLSG